MTQASLANRCVGTALIAITLLVIIREWAGTDFHTPLTHALVMVVVGIFAFQVPRHRKAFVAVAILLTLALVATSPDWKAAITRALNSTAFIAAFFTALSTLRNVAETSPEIERAGAFLAQQKAGRRYLALTFGGQSFALLLNYGAIQLLGGLAMSNARDEPNAEIRYHRTRRMLLAIQRGFISTLPWSPLSFATAISTALIPGTSWAAIVLPGLVTGTILTGIGWALDTIFKPKLSVAPSPRTPKGTRATMLPLAILLGVLVTSVSLLFVITGVRVVGLVLVIVPMISLVWLKMQSANAGGQAGLSTRAWDYTTRELPSYRGELTLLMMAGFIGTVGAAVLAPLIAQSGLDLAALPGWALLIALVWFIPLTGQFGMNPILAVTLIAPLIPEAQAVGLAPTAIVVAITAGWALSGITSPFTATTLLIGSFAGISAKAVGLRWNGSYALICGLVLSLWVLAYAFLLT